VVSKEATNINLLVFGSTRSARILGLPHSRRAS